MRPCGLAGRKRVKKREIGVESDKDGLGSATKLWALSFPFIDFEAQSLQLAPTAYQLARSVLNL